VKEAGVLDGDVRFCLVLPREALSVPVMRRVLGGTLLGFGADEDCVADILLAASEACTNVLKHGGRSGEYEVSASVGKNACLLEIADGTSSRGARPGRHPDARRLRVAGKPITWVRARASGIPGGNGSAAANGAVTINGNEATPEAGDPAAADEVTVTGDVPGAATPGDPMTGDSVPGDPAAGDSAARDSAIEDTDPGEPDAGSLQESGRGLTIMRACMDDLSLRGTRGRGTVVSMRKQITWAPAVTGRHAGGNRHRPAAGLRDAG
jgi:serine/threonine-protein kinase RsbW